MAAVLDLYIEQNYNRIKTKKIGQINHNRAEPLN
jgi:hypothetical protein